MAVTASANQAWLSTASCVFFITAMFERVSFKYRTSSAYRAILLNAGFLGQTCVLTATALGLDVFQTVAIDPVVESWLGLDRFREGLTLMLACGHVRAEDRRLVGPPGAAAPTTIPLAEDFPLPR
jgi:hypothetical protein